LKKVIISIVAALVVLTALYLFVERGVLSFGVRVARSRAIEDSEVPDIGVFDPVGASVEARYEQTAGLVALRLKRKLEIEDKKIDYLLEGIGPNALLGMDIPAFDDYVVSSPYCEKLIVINGDGKILNFFPRDEGLEGEWSGRIPLSKSVVSTDSATGSIVFSKAIADFRVLFYYSDDLLRALFADIDALDYSSFVILKNNLIILNFPDVDPGDEANADRLYALVTEEDTGSIKAEIEGSDVTVYYTKVDNLTLGFGVQTGEIGISTIGLVILISQTIVVLSLLVFVFASIGQKRGRIALAQEAATAGGVPGEGPAGPQLAGAEEGGTGALDEISTMEGGIISLSDVEEVTEVEEIGEAEVAGVVGVATEAEDIDLANLPEQGIEREKEGEKKAKAPDQQEKQERDASKDAGPIEQPIDSAAEEERKSRGGSGETVLEAGSPGGTEHIEDDISRIDSEQALPELEKLVKGRVGGDSGDTEGSTFRKETESELEPEGNQGAPVMVKEPEKEKDGTPVVIPQKEYSSKEEHYKDDELSHLIDEMEGDEEKEGSRRLDVVFKQWLKNLKLSKGALLLPKGKKAFGVAVSIGLSAESKKQLRLRMDESLYKAILAKGKLLYVKQDAFLNDGLRGKFGVSDASKIKSLFFAPVGTPAPEALSGMPSVGHGVMSGIIVVGLTAGETTSPEIIKKEIKKIIKIIPNYL
jgi:hypothetical protein